MIRIQVLAGDLDKGQQRLDPKHIKTAELQTEEKLKKLAGSAGWGFAGAIVGGLLTGGLGLAVGGLAGIVSGGNKTEVCFSCELEDGRKFLAITKKKNWQKILAAFFEKSHSKLNQAQMSSEHVPEEQGEIEPSSSNDLFEQVDNQEPNVLMLKLDLNEVQKTLASAFAEYGVTIQANQVSRQLTIVVNREAEVLVEYPKLTEIAIKNLNAAKLNGLSFSGVRQVKFIGRISGVSKAEWQRIYVLSSNGEEFISLSQSTPNNATQIHHE